MGRLPCCDGIGVKKGPWTPEEDKKLLDCIEENGVGSWRNVPKKAGLNRCGKSCRLRWTNYLRPDIKRGKFTEEEERLIIHLHSVLGNKWSAIAIRLQGRTDNEIKNYWNTHLKKKLLLIGIDPVTHRTRTDLDILSSIPSLIAAANLGNFATPSCDINALRLQADATRLAKVQIMQSLIQVLMASNSSPTMDAINLLGSSFSLPHNQFSTQDLNPVASLNLSNLANLRLFNNSFLNNISTANSISASPDNTSSDHTHDQAHSNYVSPNVSSASTRSEAWDRLKPDEDLSWKDILEQISWSNLNAS